MKRLLHFFHPLMLSVEKVKYLSNRWHLLTEKKKSVQKVTKSWNEYMKFQQKESTELLSVSICI